MINIPLQNIIDDINKTAKLNSKENTSLKTALNGESIYEDYELDVQKAGNVKCIMIDDLNYTLDKNGWIGVERKFDNEDDTRIFCEKTTDKYKINSYAHSKGSDELSCSVKNVKDKNGQLVYSEYYIPSKTVKGKHEVWQKDSLGHKSKIGIAEKTSKGMLNIEKNLTSPDGVKTHYIYAEDKKGNKLVNLKIVDNDGMTLTNHKYTYKKINNNSFVTKENNDLYQIFYGKDDIMVVKNDMEDIAKIPIGMKKTIQPHIIPMCKELSGKTYFDIKQNDLDSISSNKFAEDKDAFYDDRTRRIHIGNKLIKPSNAFLLTHEIGHFRDATKGEDDFYISEDRNLNEIYNKERESLLKQGTFLESDFLNYFTFKENDDDDPLAEIVAETNALMYANNRQKGLDIRGEYLLQYYPKTMAHIINKLSE